MRAGLSQHALAQGLATRADQVIAWESGEGQPTFRQAQKLASLTHVPFGFLFLADPPEETLPLPDLRTVGGSEPHSPSIDLLDTVRDVLRKQAWYLEYLKDQERTNLPFVGRFSKRATAKAVAADLRETMNTQDGDEFFRNLVASAERIGILIMRSGIVGANTRRKLDVSEFRGFAISDPAAPVVFINSADAPAARLFTLAHELAHIWIGSSGISDVSTDNRRSEEVFCNAVAGEFLAPEMEFRNAWRTHGLSQKPSRPMRRSSLMNR
ncbi:XRE family transcriptional regulator [Pandoraea terrae]|uniref:XRE family transcriptional regulator n=1 Tax=Pandoraea terrae TaxID=1537710 RepID=UPI0021E5180B|nr:XRE family transcriptional regulator [Pandoraea terrae]